MHSTACVLAAISIALVMSGCSRSRASVDVNALASPRAGELRSYMFVPKQPDVSPADLQFQEFAAIASRALSQKGFWEAEDHENAELVLLLDYGLGKPVYRGVAVHSFGSTTVGRELYSHARYVEVTAIDHAAFRSDKTIEVIWSTAMWSEGSSSDLREMFPVLIAAGMDFFGASSGEEVRVRLAKDAERVQALQGRQEDEGDRE